MAAGVPVIASAVDGNAEIIENEENGLLVEPGNIADAADAVIDLMTNTQKKRLLAKRAQQNLDEYSVYSMVRKINGLYTGEK